MRGLPSQGAVKMHAEAQILKWKETSSGMQILLNLPDKQLAGKLGRELPKKQINRAEIRFDDGRRISAEQRKKAYATIRDISAYTGYLPEEQKEWLKYLHICRTGSSYFSLSDCSMDTAGEFISTILEYALENGIPLLDAGIERADDAGKYLYLCLKHKKCAVCGRAGEIHHEDAIGMGNDRRKTDDSGYRKICLCRFHHTKAHAMGVPAFQRMYRVYGILYGR